MSGRTLTLTIPDELYDQLSARAREHGRAVEEEAVAALAARAATGQSPPNIADLLTAMPTLPDRELLKLVRGQVASVSATRGAELADKRQRDGLTAAEIAEAEDLAAYFNRVMLIRAAAAVELHRRGISTRPALRQP